MLPKFSQMLQQDIALLHAYFGTVNLFSIAFFEVEYCPHLGLVNYGDTHFKVEKGVAWISSMVEKLCVL